MDRTVGILIFPDVEILDFCGPFEVFSATRLSEPDRRDSRSPFDVKLIAAAAADGPVADTVRAAGGLRVVPDIQLGVVSREAAPELDILIVPGGWGVRDQLENQALLSWLRERAARAEITASVCTGAMLLGKAGLLDGRRATTHWQSLEWMRASFPDTRVTGRARVVDEGRIITSAGISAGIDMALHIVARLHGREVARRTARYMEYDGAPLSA